MTTKERKTAVENLAEEEKRMDAEIARLEAEEREANSPARVPTWDEVQAGAAGELERREARRGILPRLIAAAKVRRLEIRHERLEAELVPLREAQQEAYERMAAARTKRLSAVEEENAARGPYSDATMRIEGRERRIKEADREIRELRGEG